jgi:hypothetical protein
LFKGTIIFILYCIIYCTVYHKHVLYNEILGSHGGEDVEIGLLDWR